MKYLIISDIHENFHNLSIAFHYCTKHNITHGLVLGDLINPGIVHELGRSKMNLHVILGNNDGDVYNIFKAAHEYTNLTLSNEYVSLNLDKTRAFLIHDNNLGNLIAKSGEFDYVFCGHNHKATKETYGNSVLINPGELSGHMYGKSNFVIFDTDSRSCQLLTITGDWVDVKKYKHDTDFQMDKINFEIEDL